MLCHRIAPDRSTESLHLLERLQHTVPATFRRMRWNGRGERSHTDRSDLNVPLAFTCEIVGVARWLEGAG